MKTIVTIMLFSMLLYISCKGKTAGKNSPGSAPKEMGDTAVEKDLDTASEILGSGVVRP
jgi:hypothetical protein